MTGRDVISREEIRALTEARLTFGARGRAPDTRATLDFALDHAQARAAVLAGLDEAALSAALGRSGLAHRTVTSLAGTRETFIRRPDLGRRLSGEAEAALADAGPADVALVLGDGLSATAVMLNGVAFVATLAGRLAAEGLSVGPVILAHQARVALGDGIARAMGAETVVVALGERPGLSASDSLGVYITHRPLAETPDSARNCISNIRDAGMGVEAASDQACRLILAMRRTGQSGVALSQSLAAGARLAAPDDQA
ncbi:ethanolamine ammonia-lyase subunit EutC [Roseibacterium sp. SDUM158016]|uniref:ethanolamine ammonia-lyase subunit EutC n=1 Tax=Roseicyclus sediminis TaxID=2980997 RepID=UPI0021D2D984|nr:ethanolamine ammonia-lyase subunit EutC [Roseibacterium sp. SDUM158016]MCU4653434.1 ethanolamine ammonia-lyase subunit EutC [Roseibacterium sp. SDUM158016]